MAPATGPDGRLVAVGTVPPAGTVSFSPGRMRLFVVNWLTLSSAANGTPTLAAIPARKSPGLTVYSVADEVGESAADAEVGRVRVPSTTAERDAARSARCTRDEPIVRLGATGPLRILDKAEDFTLQTLNCPSTLASASISTYT
jgi:hypothetical protein